MPEKISLKAARVNANLTIRDAAKKIGVCETTLIRWEKHPEIVQAKYHKRISDTYKFPSDFIFFAA